MPYKDPLKELKSKRISHWKRQGIISDDWDKTYDIYVNTIKCDLCPKIFSSPNDKHLEHDHSILDKPNIRNVCCCKCNLQKYDVKINTNTGERWINKRFRKDRNKDYYYIVVWRDRKRIFTNKTTTLEKAIILRDEFIKNNPNVFT